MARRVLSLHQSRGKFLLIAVWSCAFVLPALGQTSAVAKDESADRIVYDTVSIHPCKTGSGMSISLPPNRFSARCTTLWGLIFNAYDVRPNDAIPGLPSWAIADTWDVEAAMDAETQAALEKLPREQYGAQRQRMLQAILADRFKLAIHRETRERPIYALLIAKGGPKVSPGDGKKSSGTSWGRGRIEANASPIDRFAFTLSDVVGREVVDRTGLTGKYDIRLTWTPDDLQGTPDAGPTLFTAIEEQLGLKLVSTKGPVDTIVVDHVGKPVSN